MIDADADAPPFEQVRRQIVAQIASGELPAGFKLPAVRALAATLGLAANTVARAYRELEAEGFVLTQGRNGTIVANTARLTAQSADLVDRATTEHVAAMRALGLSDEAIVAAVQRAV